jgi:hypothetical protein
MQLIGGSKGVFERVLLANLKLLKSGVDYNNNR